MQRFTRTLPILVLALLAPLAAAQAQPIGVAAQVATESYRTPAGGVQDGLAREDPVFRQDLIATDPSGAARLSMADDTVITVGPGSQVVLDEFLYNPGANSGDVATRITVGGMRFISGQLPSDSYVIRTPVAVIGLRGTDVTVLVTPGSGATRLIVLVGEAWIQPRNCQAVTYVPAGRMLDILTTACGGQEGAAAPLPGWARGRAFATTSGDVVNHDTVTNDGDDGNPGGATGGGSGGNTPD